MSLTDLKSSNGGNKEAGFLCGDPPSMAFLPQRDPLGSDFEIFQPFLKTELSKRAFYALDT